MKVAGASHPQPARYLLGLDFGTLSGRALLVNAANGREVATAVHPYQDGVISERLPGDRRLLPPDTALQNPADYLDVLSIIIPRVLRLARIRPEQVAGIGLDFTSCTMLPTRADGTPLCLLPRWRKNPHAWVKLWKHHSAQPEADRINAVARERGERFIMAYNGRYSSEWFFSKLLETVRAAPKVYDAADRFIEAGDWLVWQLCGTERRCVSAAGFKAMWVCPAPDDPSGKSRWTYPGPSYFRALHPKLENVVEEKLGTDLWPLGARAGGLTPAMAKRTGLLPGTPVATANIDAHVAVPACGVTTPGKLVLIAGTSSCHLLLAKEQRTVEGACGVVRDGVVPGYWGYEAGQAGVGDLFAWHVEQCLPVGQASRLSRTSKLHPIVSHGVRAGTSPALQAKLTGFEWLEKEAARLRPGETGLLALDWWNGCRSVLMDSDLSGLLVGATLGTRPHHVHRALMEATAFGTRKIIEAFTGQGMVIDEVYACGGLAHKSPLLMQIYADVTGRPIRLAASEQTCALGAAIHAAVAAGIYQDVHEAARRLAPVRARSFKPVRAHTRIYDELYAEYNRLHDLFGRDPASPMKVLKRLKRQARIEATRPK